MFIFSGELTLQSWGFDSAAIAGVSHIHRQRNRVVGNIDWLWEALLTVAIV
jgi:hypothetical protein